MGTVAGCSVAARLRQSDLFRDYQRAFEGLTGLPLMMREAGSFRTPMQGSDRMNPFCALMTKANKTCAACLQLQQRLEVDAVMKPKTLECYAGLSETAVPVRVGDKVLGYLQTGQVFLRKPSTKRLNENIRALYQGGGHADLRQLKSTFLRTRVLTRKQYAMIIRLLAVFAEHLAIVSNQILLIEASAEPRAVTVARRFIAEHQGDKLRLADVARAVNMSACYFCKVFRHATGVTFMEFVSRSRVEAVKQGLLNPHTRISEAAFAAGFQSLSQFNRVFQRITGETPSRYRSRSLTWSSKCNQNGNIIRAA